MTSTALLRLSTRTMYPLGLVTTVVVVDDVDPLPTVVEVDVEVVTSPNVVIVLHADTEPP